NPGQSATLIATFKPLVANPWNYTGIITLTSNSSSGNLTINMSGAGINTAALSSLSCANGSFTGAGSDACTVSLTAAAPTGGLAVSLSSSSSSVTLPASIVIPSGSTAATFSASVAAVSSSQTATITAAAAGISRSFALSLAPSAGGTLTANAASIPFGQVYV